MSAGHMVEVRISDAARIDLEDIRTVGIARFGQDAAAHHLREIGQAFALLADHPSAGQPRPEFSQDIRAIARRPHRILYTVIDGAVLIVRIIRQARDVSIALRDDR